MRWKVLNSKEVFQAGFFRVRVDECALPDGRVMPRYYVMEFPDWVNIVPVTEDGRLVMVEQYRHGADGTFLEVPGGSTHPGPGESPRAAAERELMEETGFQAKNWESCGIHFPNPALQGNRMHTFVATGCGKVDEPSLDPFEDLRTVLMPVPEVYRKLYSGEIKHSIIATSLTLAIPVLRRLGFLGEVA